MDQQQPGKKGIDTEGLESFSEHVADTGSTFLIVIAICLLGGVVMAALAIIAM